MKGILKQHEWHLVSASCLHVSKEFIKCTLSRKIPIMNLKEFFPTVRLVHSDKHTCPKSRDIWCSTQTVSMQCYELGVSLITFLITIYVSFCYGRDLNCAYFYIFFEACELRKEWRIYPILSIRAMCVYVLHKLLINITWDNECSRGMRNCWVHTSSNKWLLVTIRIHLGMYFFFLVYSMVPLRQFTVRCLYRYSACFSDVVFRQPLGFYMKSLTLFKFIFVFRSNI